MLYFLALVVGFSVGVAITRKPKRRSTHYFECSTEFVGQQLMLPPYWRVTNVTFDDNRLMVRFHIDGPRSPTTGRIYGVYTKHEDGVYAKWTVMR